MILMRRLVPPTPRALALAGVLALISLQAVTSEASDAPGWAVLDTVDIGRTPVDDLEIGELSGLAWDPDEHLLYAVSDRGRVFHFEIRFDEAGRRIVGATARRGFVLRSGGSDGPRRYNAEGLDIIDGDNGRRGDTRLVVALENGPRVVTFSVDGIEQSELSLPGILTASSSYRKGNNRLESISVTPAHGPVTAPQRPLADQPETRHTVFALGGASWRFDAPERTSIKALETLPAGQVLVLERQGSGRQGRAALRVLDPANCKDDPQAVPPPAQAAPPPAQAAPASVCESRAQVLDDSAVGENFEGMARLSDDRFLLVSDDGGGGQRVTKLMLVQRLRP